MPAFINYSILFHSRIYASLVTASIHWGVNKVSVCCYVWTQNLHADGKEKRGTRSNSLPAAGWMSLSKTHAASEYESAFSCKVTTVRVLVKIKRIDTRKLINSSLKVCHRKCESCVTTGGSRVHRGVSFGALFKEIAGKSVVTCCRYRVYNTCTCGVIKTEYNMRYTQDFRRCTHGAADQTLPDLFSGAFEKFRKTTVSCVMSVFPSVCLLAWSNSAPTEIILTKFYFRFFFKYMSRKFKFH